MTDQGTLPDVFLQAEAASAEREREVTDYKTWAREWADEVRSGAAPDGDDEDSVPESSAPAVGWVNPEASAVGVASFWANYRPPEPAEPQPEESVQTEPDLDAKASLTPTTEAATEAEPADFQQSANVGADDEVGGVRGAMKSALAAARAELDGPDEIAPTESGAAIPEASLAAEQEDAPVTPSYSDDLVAKPLPTVEEQVSAEPAEPAAADEAPADLDAATARKLKMLRRLDPRASVAELLARIQAEEKPSVSPGVKKRWFGRK